MLAFEETEEVSVEYVDDYLSNNSDVTHVAFVHCETTTGILNPIKELSHIVKMHGKKLIVDCMSSFGGIPLDVNELGIDFLISSSNKCIQGVPGFVFTIPDCPGGGAMLFLAGEGHGNCEKVRWTRRHPPMGRRGVTEYPKRNGGSEN